MLTDPLTRAREQLELAARLLYDADNVGLWIKSDDDSDNRNKRRWLREADWAVSDASRALKSIDTELTDTTLLADVLAMVAELEPLPELRDREINARISGAMERVDQLLDRVRVLIASRDGA